MCTQRKRKSDKLCNQVSQIPLSCQTKHVTYFSIQPRIKYCVTCNKFNPTVRVSSKVMHIWEESNFFLKLLLELFSIFPLSSPSAHSEMFCFTSPPPKKIKSSSIDKTLYINFISLFPIFPKSWKCSLIVEILNCYGYVRSIRSMLRTSSYKHVRSIMLMLRICRFENSRTFKLKLRTYRNGSRTLESGYILDILKKWEIEKKN